MMAYMRKFITPPSFLLILYDCFSLIHNLMCMLCSWAFGFCFTSVFVPYVQGFMFVQCMCIRHLCGYHLRFSLAIFCLIAILFGWCFTCISLLDSRFSCCLLHRCR